jgi:hypothetical protein
MGGWQAFFWITGALLALASLVMALARTPPTDAISNLSKWAEWLGIRDIPSWLRDRRADRWAGDIAILVVILGVGLYAWLSEQNWSSSLTTGNPPLSESKPQATPPSMASPLYPANLTSDEKKLFLNKIDRYKGKVKTVAINRSTPSDGDSLMMDFFEVFRRDGFNTVTGFQEPQGPDETGVMISVPDKNRPSPDELSLQGILKEIGIGAKFVDIPKDATHADLVIFMGPSAL